MRTVLPLSVLCCERRAVNAVSAAAAAAAPAAAAVAVHQAGVGCNHCRAWQLQSLHEVR